jgi:hypothetical protein
MTITDLVIKYFVIKGQISCSVCYSAKLQRLADMEAPNMRSNMQQTGPMRRIKVAVF